MSNIEWTDETWNVTRGCTRVSAGCDNCYAVTMTHRLASMPHTRDRYGSLTVLNNRGERHFNGTVRVDEDALRKPLSWRKPRRVFVNSMSDLFHPSVPYEFIDRVFAVMSMATQHTFQVLTKRPERMAEYLARVGTENTRGERLYSTMDRVALCLRRMAERGAISSLTSVVGGAYVARNWPLPNVWLGTSVESEYQYERIEHLRRCPAAVRFLSCEPLLGPLEHLPLDGIDWVIVGGESGPGARPCNVDWVRSIIEQCRAAGVACFVKQLGRRPYDQIECDDWPSEWGGGVELRMGEPAPAHQTYWTLDTKGGDIDEWPEDLRVREYPDEPQEQEATK